ncbi:Os05g0471900 [Oryza sativa Japonica Group]|uniref:Os05g0471900 protein n=1 Tax=Oryza sativa subsp. japonica TaxID=39947 RepID=A0A0P0WNJ5_ORYSJ|nr:Os05g0471900 [Oryza sativa Japonica Group]
MATMNSTNPTLVRYSSVRLQAAGEERPNHLCSPAAGANVSGGGGSSSVFTRVLHAAQARKMHQRKQLPGSAVSNSKKTSGIKGKKVVQEKIYTRCTPAILSDLFLGFGDQQKELVKQMEFDGLLSMRLTKLNKQFGAWILCKLDPSSGNLFAGSRHEICLTCEDVSLLLGIPCGRKEILPAIKNEVKDVKAYKCEIFEKDSFDGLTIVTIQRILEKKFNRTMTVHEQIVFKTAFIIFVVTKFLAPQSVNNHISIRYMKALVDVENIHKYNWAEFVLHDIKDAAAALQHKIRHRKSIGYINGCIILPQLFYLDNLDFGTDTPEQENIPRIGVYNDSMIAEFIERDVILKNRNPFPAYGKMKLRNKHDEKYNLGHHTGAIEAIHVDRTYDARSDIEPPSFNLGITQDIEEANMVACTPGHDISNVAEDSDKEQELNFLARTPDQPISKSVDASDKSGEDITFNRKIWVHISQPVPMSLSLHDIQQAIRLDTQMQEETFNVAVQVLAADEIQRFGGTDFVGWRHFLNQDFAMFATAGDDQWNPEDHLPSFKDDSLIPYDECMKLAFPDWDEDIPNWVSEFPSAIPAINNRINEIFERNFCPTYCHSKAMKLFCRTSSFTA